MGEEQTDGVLTAMEIQALREDPTWGYNEIRRLRSALAAAERVVGENYVDLLDQMDEAWGSAPEIGRPEINAMIGSRIVHRPTASLRQRLALIRDAFASLQAAFQAFGITD